jgi:hypothetical protein
MNFKLLRGKEECSFLQLEPIQQLSLTRYNPQNVEFCFQFGDDEPMVFGNGPNECSINISPTNNGNITFTQNDNVFKLFARERQDG